MDDDIQSLTKRLNIHQKNLRYLEVQAARYGSSDVPLKLQNSIDAEQETIDTITAKIKHLTKARKTTPQQGEPSRLNQPLPRRDLTWWLRVLGIGVGAATVIALFVLIGRQPPSDPAVPTPASTAASVAPSTPPTAQEPAPTPISPMPTAVAPTSAQTAPPPPSIPQYEYSYEIKPEDGFDVGIIVNLDSSDNLYIVDTNNKRILKLSPSSQKPATLIHSNNLDNQKGNPLGVAIDTQNNLYTTWSNNQVRKFDMNGQLMGLIWGKNGTADGSFMFPTSIAVDSRNEFVYVADTGNNRIQKFDLEGKLLNAGTDLTNIDFKEPYGINVDSVGNLYVADSGNHRILKFDRNGILIQKWGTSDNTPGKGAGEFNEPLGVTVDSKDNVYIADSGNNRIQMLNDSGAWAIILDSSVTGNAQFQFPRSVSVDSSRTVYIADSPNKRIQVFKPKQ